MKSDFAFGWFCPLGCPLTIQSKLGIHQEYLTFEMQMQIMSGLGVKGCS